MGTVYFVMRGTNLGNARVPARLGPGGFLKRSNAEEEARLSSKNFGSPHLVVSVRLLSKYSSKGKRLKK